MTVIWSGVTSEGAVVPVQVDGAGRVVATTGEPPGPAVIEYNGASAWGTVDDEGNLVEGLNCSAAGSEGGIYISFVTPMPNANYSITGATADIGNASGSFAYSNVSANGFLAYIRNAGGSAYVSGFSFAVFSSNALPPMGGTGSDSWGSCQGDGTLDASFNVASVTRASTGRYDVVFSVPMPTANYAVMGAGAENNGAGIFQTELRTTTGFRVVMLNNSATIIDFPFSFSVNATNAVLPVTITAEQLNAVTNNWYLEEADGSILTTRYKVEMQEGIKFAGGKAGITRDGELYFTSNGGKYVIAVNDEQIGLTRIDSAY